MNIRKFLCYIYRISLTFPSWIQKIKVGGIIRKTTAIIYEKYIIFNYPHSTPIPKTKSEVIISLTSFPKRIQTLWMVIECLMRQTIAPKKIILWLSELQFPDKQKLPSKLLEQQERGLEIRFVPEDLRSHKKYYYTFLEYPDSPVLLADDDILYSPNLIEELLKDFGPGTVHCGYGSYITRNQDGSVKPYNEWRRIATKDNQNDFFFGSGGGTLLLPSSLSDYKCRKDLFTNLCPIADDIWLNAMARINKLSITKVRTEPIIPVKIKDNETLADSNLSKEAKINNDIQIENVNRYYLDITGEKIF